MLVDDVTEEARELGPLTKAVSNKHVKVLIDEFKHFSSPSLIIPRLEESNICEEYDKIDDITYKEICGNVDVNSDLTTNNTRRMNFIEYYYRTPTSALRELIKERNEIISGRTFDTCPTKPIVNDKSQPLFKVDNVLYVEVCNYCSKVFKTKQLLNIHYNMYHRMLSKQESNKKKIVKGKKRRKKKIQMV
ncbi:hypothetical protein NQ314_000976 [Rhamnusium bicolor]|uniref:C2H2-type domain-containing protein n=1 Tax=Rhamnusium bicolor TaxID=1586634 RepID=A0AAV8ZVI4_9CUCU|nr:hypothetical protein NQ314_000976 [Rhamnusium bicolor]